MKKVAVALVLVLASFALVACGSSSSSSSSESTGAESTAESEAGGGGEEAAGGSSGTLTIEAAGSGFAYTSKTAEWEAGKFTVEFNNPQSVTHDVAIEDSGGEVVGETELVAEGTSAAEVDLKPGTYKFFCTVPGHREAGMEGTLTVK
jgi:plastocyanin